MCCHDNDTIMQHLIVDRPFCVCFSGLNSLRGTACAGGPAPLEDGPGRYTLVGFVSHMGANTACGHYVCHLLKEGKWVIYNDEKVAVSEHPPVDLGYMYLYKRSDLA